MPAWSVRVVERVMVVRKEPESGPGGGPTVGCRGKRARDEGVRVGHGAWCPGGERLWVQMLGGKRAQGCMHAYTSV